MSRRLPAAITVAVLCAGLLTIAAPSASATTSVVDVTQAPYSAPGDGTTNARTQLQHALDDVAAAGGGTVLLPAGRTFLSGSVTVGSNTTLDIEGTLLESQNDADYATPQTHGHLYPSNFPYSYGDLAAQHNRPLVYSTDAHDVQVVGAGTIQLTRAAGSTAQAIENATIHVSGVGFYRVQHYTVSGLSILGASSYSTAFYTTSYGTISNLTITASDQDSNTDGISTQASQHLRITGNTIHSGDDGIYAWASYRDQRGETAAWWSSDDPQPSYDIEIDHNNVIVDRRGHTLCCSAVALIAWGGGGSPTGGNAPDRRLVQISDVTVHDNHLEAGYPFRCWCGIPDQSPITRITLSNNTYVWGFSPGANLRGSMTDFVSDDPQWYQYMASRAVQNGDFEKTGDAWWTASGDAGATTATTPAVRGRAFRTQAATVGGTWAGYVRGSGSLAEGYLPTRPGDLPPIGISSVHHVVSAKVTTSGAPAQLIARDSCDGHVVGSQTVQTTTWTDVSFAFDSTDSSCVRGLRLSFALTSGAACDWAMLDDVVDAATHAGTWIDSTDPSVTRTGSWSTYSGPKDIGGTHLVGTAAGANLTVPFSGTRAEIYAIRDSNLGRADVYLDGVRKATVDYYSATRQDGVIVYDTGEIAAGSHTIQLRTLGTHNAASTNNYTVFDALVLPDASS